MPTYLDRHPTTPLPPEMVAAVRAQMGNRQPDGVTPRQFFAGAEQSYCLSDADNPEAIEKHHTAMGIMLAPGAIELLTATLP
jgi:hypothetical protein